MGGRMWLHSELNIGSTFGFTVPIGTPRPNRRVPAMPSEATFRPLVVVVEDDRRSADLLTVYLESAGFEVESAHDGRSGLDAIGRLLPVGVILDIRLPQLDGWDVLVELKADPATASIPVIVVSMLDERAEGLSLGAAEYLLKPVRREELLSALARVGVRSEPRAVEAPPLGSESR
jgi:DNA-binding response OmpR family regulator